MDEINQDIPGVLAPPPLIYLSGLAAGLLLSLAFPLSFLSITSRLILGFLLFALGSVTILTAFRTMTAAGTPVDPHQPVQRIVTSGPYRLSRNPIYLSLGLICLGIGFLADAAWVLILLPVVLVIIDRGVIAREERYLERKFGPAYLRYKSSVRRWI
jgi:protein-S-isoprenylcysteine O-methyltransferase Ste14